MNELISTNRITADLGPFFGGLLNFKLVLADKKEQVRRPPPSYIFAPYYVDQDRSWQKPWDCFKDLGMLPSSAKALAEYHSGLRPNAFYEAKAERDLLSKEMQTTDLERKAVDQAFRKVKDAMPATPVTLDIAAFSGETDKLIAESQSLHNEQVQYRTELSTINEEYQLWAHHVAVVQSALSEIDEAFSTALKEPENIECPMCGEHYQNHIADQFELIADKDDLVAAMQTGRQHLRRLDEELGNQRAKIERVATAIDRIQQVLAIHREDISLRDVVIAEGRNEALRVLQERLAALDAEYGEKQRRLAEAEQRMKSADSKKRKQDITLYFSRVLSEFNQELDVKLPEKARPNIQGVNIGRGSAGPRGLAAYYYAFLQTAALYGSATFCPIVIDAPNQQGQDQGHLQTMMQFLLKKMPQGAQVIIGTEAITDAVGASVIDVSNLKDQVLRDEAYEQTLNYIRPFIRQSIM